MRQQNFSTGNKSTVNNDNTSVNRSYHNKNIRRDNKASIKVTATTSNKCRGSYSKITTVSSINAAAITATATRTPPPAKLVVTAAATPVRQEEAKLSQRQVAVAASPRQVEVAPSTRDVEVEIAPLQR